MKPNILTKTIAALVFALPLAHAQDSKPEEKQEGHKSEKKNSSSSVVTSSDGTATVTIDINGKKETRTFKLGDGDNTFSFGKDGDGATASGRARAGGGGFVAPGQLMPPKARREKGLWLGIAMEPVQEVVRAQLPLAPGEGVVVNHVAPESPAAKAGLQPNDILLRFEDQIIVEPSQLQKLIAMKKPGESVKLTYLRKGEKKDTTVTLVEHELEAGEYNPMQWLQMEPGSRGFEGGAGSVQIQRLQDQLKQLKEKYPGVVVEKRSWTSGEPAEMLRGQLEKVQREIEKAGIPGERLEQLRKDLDRVRREVEEAIEMAKRKVGGKLERLRETPKDETPKDGNPKKPGEPS